MKILRTLIGGGQAKQPGRPVGTGCGTSENAALKALRSRLAQLKFAAVDERRQADRLSRELDRLEQERRSAIALARLNGTGAAVDELGTQIEQTRQAIKDAEGAAAELELMHGRESDQLPILVFSARKELSVALDRRFAELAQIYNEHVLTVAAAARDLLALQELMIKLGAGNSNGFESAVYLPQAKPGEGRTLKPIFRAGDSSCMGDVMRRRDEFADEFHAVGFEI